MNRALTAGSRGVWNISSYSTTLFCVLLHHYWVKYYWKLLHSSADDKLPPRCVRMFRFHCLISEQIALDNKWQRIRGEAHFLTWAVVIFITIIVVRLITFKHPSGKHTTVCRDTGSETVENKYGATVHQNTWDYMELHGTLWLNSMDCTVAVHSTVLHYMSVY